MSVRTGQSITKVFTTRAFGTGGGVNADSLPTGTLYVNGVANGATVTVTNIDTGRYMAAVTLPTLAVGDVVDLSISATVSSVSDKAVIWSDSKDVLLDGSGDVTFANTSIATVTNQLTAAAIATGVWQDTTAGDFTTALSIGKSIMNGVALGTGLTVNDLTTKTGFSLTQTFPTNFSALGISAGGHVSNVDTITTYTGNTPQTGDSFARLGIAGVGLTNLGDTRIANLDATVSSRTKPADTQAAVTLVTTTTNLTNLPAVTTDWLTAAGVKADAVAKIQSGLSTYAGADTSGTTTLLARITAAVVLAGSAPSWYTAPVDVSAHVDAIYAKLPAGNIADESLVIAATDALMTRIGTLSSHGDSAWATATGFVLAASAPSWYAAPVDVSASVTAIKAKTDSLTFTIAGNLDANVQYVNDVQIKGTGTSGDPWNPV